MYCCHTFENIVQNAGNRGFAILVRRLMSVGLMFELQERAIAFADEASMFKRSSSEQSSWTMAQPSPASATLAASGIIRFCPFCGRRLEELIAADPKFFEELEAKHKPFLVGTP